MKKTLLLISSLLVSVSSFAQIYQNNTDVGVLWVWPDQADSPATIFEYDADGITITPDGSHAQYEPAGGLGIGETLDVEGGATLYVKARGTGSPVFRIDLTDADGFDTSGAPQEVNLSEEFEIHTFLFEGNFKDQFSAACAALPESICDSDPTNIVGMNFFIGAAAANYQGTVEIEWMSFGESLEDLVQASEFDLRYNKIGYTVDQQKLVTIVADGEFSGKEYTVSDSNNNIMLSGTTSDANLWGAAAEYAYSVDVSEITNEGSYKFSIDEMEVTFEVLEDPYSDMREGVFKYYYYNRASMDLTAQYAGEFAREAGIIDDVVLVHKSAATNSRPEGTEISATKGWYDAGDYNKYIVNSGISTYTLLASFEHYSSYFSDTSFNIPENGGDLPDILDETKWNLDWMLAMQDPNDGGIYHKLTGLNFSGSIMPNEYTFDRYVVQKTTAAALDFAAVMATASRVYANYDANYSATMLQAAKDAYVWAQNNPEIYYDQHDLDTYPLLDDVVTGEYEDFNVEDEFQWAAVELFITTEDESYSNDIDINNINGGVPSWQNVATLALYSLTNATNISSSIVNSAKASFLEIADTYKGRIQNTGMSVAMASSDFVWGSNGVAGNQIMVLINAYKISEDSSYLDAAYAALDYMFGRNGTGYSYITGYGDSAPIDPHHRISFADNVAAPVPGMVVGGPHSSVPLPLDGECLLSDYTTGLEPAKTYFDGWCSYSTNEVTINWNAPMLYSLHALRAIQTDNTGTTLSNPDNYQDAFAERFEIYPNPTSGEVSLSAKEENQNGTIDVFTLGGEKIITTAFDNDNSVIDLSNSAIGIYLMQITIGDQTFTTKVVKQ